jgi:hypothetical protein
MMSRRRFLGLAGLSVASLAALRLKPNPHKPPKPTRTPTSGPTRTPTPTSMRTIRYGEGIKYGDALYGQQVAI